MDPRRRDAGSEDVPEEDIPVDGEEVPEDGRASFEEVTTAPYAVMAAVADVEQARVVVENLQNLGIPANAIELVDAETKDPTHPKTKSDIAESDAFASLSKSVIVGGCVGLVAGALLGLLLSYLIAPLGPIWGMIFGAIFGVAIGGAAGGMSVAKYSSPVWHETFQVEEGQRLRVAVHHASVEVVDKAEEVMNSQLEAGRVRRLR